MVLKAACFAAALFLWGDALAGEIVGAVVRVADGDTISHSWHTYSHAH